MEDVNNYISDVRSELEESKKSLEGLANDVKRLAGIVLPALKEHTEALRLARMAAVAEVRESLSALRDVRTFFMEADYKHEMERLDQLVRLCRAIKELKDDGVFDAVCDSALRLAVKAGER